MSPFKKILWPTDFSEPSYVALECAIEFAAHFGATLELVHVVDMLPTVISDMGLGFVDLPVARQVATRDARRNLQEILSTRVPKSIKSSTVVRGGYAPEQIRLAAEESQADLIVIATHGYTGWRHLVLGSVAEKVVQISPCTVLTIPQSQAADETDAAIANRASGITR